MISVLRFRTGLVKTAGIGSYVVVGVLYIGSGLVVPHPVAFGLWVVWALGLIVTIRLAIRRPWWSVVAALAALVFWVAFVQSGSWLFGWTA